MRDDDTDGETGGETGDGTDGGTDGGARPRKPTPVRPAPGRPSPARSAREGGGERPVSVREAMEAERDAPEPVEPPSVTLEADEETWIVRVEGRSRTGLPPDAGVPLLHLTFSRESEPEERVLEILGVGRALEEIHESELRELLARARPVPDAWEPSPLFPDTRQAGKGR